MTDWLTPDERAKHYPHASYDPRSWNDAAGRRAYVIGQLLDHAAEADRRLAELDELRAALKRIAEEGHERESDPWSREVARAALTNEGTPE